MHSRYWILELDGGFVDLSSNRPIFLTEESYIGHCYSSELETREYPIND